MESMNEQFYVMSNGAQLGPLPMVQIAEQWRARKIETNALYWREGWPEWKPLNASTEMAACHTCNQKSNDNRAAAKFLGVVILFAVGFMIFQLVTPPKSKPRSPASNPQPVVENSPWDNSVSQVKRWLEKNAKDPKSLEYIEWSKVTRDGAGFLVRVKYRAKNSFGGYVIDEKIFVLDGRGEVVSAVSKP